MASAVRPVVAPMIMIAPLVSVSMVPAARLPAVRARKNVWALECVSMVSADRHVAKQDVLQAKRAAMMDYAPTKARVLPTVIVPLASATMAFVVMRVSAKTLNNV